MQAATTLPFALGREESCVVRAGGVVVEKILMAKRSLVLRHY